MCSTMSALMLTRARRRVVHTAIGEILWLLHAFKLLELVLELPTLHIQQSQPGEVMFKLWIFSHQASLNSDNVPT
jgi:hypothetical protein